MARDWVSSSGEGFRFKMERKRTLIFSSEEFALRRFLDSGDFGSNKAL